MSIKDHCHAVWPRHRGLSLVALLVMLFVGAAALYFPDSWVARHIGLIMFFFACNAYAALDMSLEARCADIAMLSSQLEDLSRELEATNRGLERVHDRTCRLEHKEHAA